jgi:hypothetical protein
MKMASKNIQAGDIKIDLDEFARQGLKMLVGEKMMDRLAWEGRLRNMDEGQAREERKTMKMVDLLDAYVELLEAIKGRVKDERTAVAIMQEMGKDRRTGQMHEVTNWRLYGLATEKQKDLLKDLGIAASAELTREKASELIDRELGKRDANMRSWGRL